MCRYSVTGKSPSTTTLELGLRDAQDYFHWVMAYGHYEGKQLDDPVIIRAMFTREALLKSDRCRKRLVTKQQRDIVLCMRNIQALKDFFLNKPGYQMEATRLGIHQRLLDAERELARVSCDSYLDKLVGTLGAEIPL